MSPQENRRRIAKQHRNNAAGRVFLATSVADNAERIGHGAINEKGREMIPAFFASQDFKTLMLAPLDFGDLVGLGAAGRDDFHRRALLLADQRARQRRGDGDAAFLGVGLRLADDLPHRLLVGVLIDQGDGGAELDGVAAQF